MSDSLEASHPTGAHQGGPGWLKRLEQVDRHVASTVEKVMRDLEDLAEAAEEGAVTQLLAATARVDGEKTQSGILLALLEESCRFASRTAFFLTRPGEVRGWAGRGFSGRVALEDLQFDYEDDGVWARLAQASGALALDSADCAAVCGRLDVTDGSRGVLIPFILRGQLGGVLYADRLEGEGAPGQASLQLLTHSASQAIETAAVRGSGISPTLRSAGDDGAGAVDLWQPPEVDTEQEEASVGAIAVGTAATAVAAAVAVSAVATEDATVAEKPDLTEDPEVAEPVALAEFAPVTDEAESVVEVADAVGFEAEQEPEERVEPVDVEPVDVVFEAEAQEEVETAVDVSADESVVEEDVVVDDDTGVDFEMVSVPETDAPVELEAEGFPGQELDEIDDIAGELEPEPELEDTSDLWAASDNNRDEPSSVAETAFEMTSPVEAAPAFDEPSPAFDESPAPTPLAPPVGQETVRLDIAALQGQMHPAAAEVPAVEEDTAKLPQWEVESVPATDATSLVEPPAPSYELEPELSEPVTEPMAAPNFGTSLDNSEDPTIMTSRDNLIPAPPTEDPVASPMAGGYVPPAPAEVTPPSSSGFAAPPPQKPDSTGTTQVVPPTDIQGPGSAFGATGNAIPDGEQALHEEARRLARLLVSEIKLYNEEIIEEGRRAGNIYDRLKDDIDRSRQMYEERIDPRLKDSGNDYFHQELVQRLAGGDKQLLGY